MERLRQLVATGGNRFGRFEPFCGSPDLRPVAIGCNHGAPIKAPSFVVRSEDKAGTRCCDVRFFKLGIAGLGLPLAAAGDGGYFYSERIDGSLEPA
jgi:hypothetical protein